MNGIYPGIDAALYFEEGLPRYDIMVAPHADPNDVRIRFTGAEKIWINPSGDLAMTTSLGTLYQRKLFAYQNRKGTRRQVACSFTRHADGTVGFSLGSYDRNLPLVIDPLLYSSFIGGNGNDGARALATDGLDNICFTGYAGSSSPIAGQFPTTYGAYDITQHGGNDLFVAKMKASTGTLVFSTLMGGAQGDEGTDIEVGVRGAITVCGITSSEDFPTTPGAFSTRYNGGASDGFLLKLNSSGSMLVFSTFIGGARGDGISSMSLLSAEKLPFDIIRLCGHTASDDFPTTPGAYDRTFNGETDIFSAGIDETGTTLVSSTYIGGSGADIPSSVKLNGSASTAGSYIIANTLSPDMPTTGGAIDRSYNGGTDAAILRISVDDSRLEYGTYLGGSRDDHGRDIALSSLSGEIFVGGYTASENFPTSASAYSRSFNGGTYDAFAARIGVNTARLVYSTFLGGSGDDYGQVIATYDRWGSMCAKDVPCQRSLWVAGYTASGDFPFSSSVPAFDTTKDGGHDGFISLLSDRGDSLVYTTFVGGEERDVINDLATITVSSGDLPRQMLFLCGTTISFNFPTTPEAYNRQLSPAFSTQPVPAIGTYDAFVCKFLPASVVLLDESPESLRRLCAAGSYELRWKSFDLNVLRLDLLDEEGRNFYSNILTNFPGSVEGWKWLLPKNQPPGKFHLSVRDFDNPRPFFPIAADTGLVNFEITPGPKLVRGIANTLLCPGDRLEFSALALGEGLTYLWRRNGFTIFGATRSIFRIDSVTAADTGRYELVIFDACDNVALTEVVRVDLKEIASVAWQPEDARTCPGGSASFTVVADAEEPVYQWLKNGVPIPGATSATYTIDSADAQDNGYYSCRVANGVCPTSPVTTRTARLIVIDETITQQPQSRSVQVGSPVALVVSVTGINPTYQWRRNGVPIPGATISSYIINQARFSDSGVYDVVITGECTISSDTARLTVTERVASTGERPPHMAGRSLLVTPNPATGRTVVRLLAGGGADILHDPELALYDLLGRKVMDLSARFAGNGYLGAEFDARQLPPGIYYCRLAAGATSIGTTVVITR